MHKEIRGWVGLSVMVVSIGAGIAGDHVTAKTFQDIARGLSASPIQAPPPVIELHAVATVSGVWR